MDITKEDRAVAAWETSRAVRAARKPLRIENCAWQRAAAGLLVLSVGVNALLYGALGREASRHALEVDKLRSEIQTAERIRDDAVRELGALALDAARERREREALCEAYEAVGAYEYIGECVVTYYCPCEECCGRWADGLTATGLPAGPGIVAVDPDVIALGSTVIIDGVQYLAADTGVTGNHIDVCVEDHALAEALGVGTARVWVEKGETDDGEL